MSEPCKSCANKDIHYVLRGMVYKPEMVCVYGMSHYKTTKQCEKYEARDDTTA